MDNIEGNTHGLTTGKSRDSACLLMFSGGRDSSLAALRLATSGSVPTLVTISSDHLLGLEAVRIRLRELRRLLPGSTRWIRIDQPKNLATDTSFYEQTCLPCHHAYVVAAAAVGRSLAASRLAFGYTAYQSDWPEQTPLATRRLSALLSDYGIKLELPVFDVLSREDVQKQLALAGLSPDALEQKCSRQITNVKLDDAKLTAQIELWESAIRRSMDALDSIPQAIMEDTTLDRLDVRD